MAAPKPQCGGLFGGNCYGDLGPGAIPSVMPGRPVYAAAVPVTYAVRPVYG